MEEKNSKETKLKKEKRNSIVHQVVRPMVFFLICLLVIESAFLFLYYINYSVRQREESASRLAIYTATQFEKYDSIGWITDYWKNNYEDMDLVYDYKTNELREDTINHYFTEYTAAKDVATAEIEDALPWVQKMYAEVAYSRICDSLDSIKKCYEPMFLYSFVIEDGDILFLATGTLDDELRYSQGGDVFEIGTTTPYIEGVYPVLDEILETGEVPENLEMSLSPGADRSVVHMFAPVKDENGNVVMYIGVAVKWRDLLTQALGMMATLSGVTLVVFILIGVYIVRLLLKKVIGPVNVEKEALKVYGEDKDSEKLKSNLSEVKSNNEIEELAIDFSEMADELERYMVENQKAAIDKERIKSELSMAKTIQESRLPNKFPPFPDRHDFDIYASMTPTKEVAGDFYDFFMVDNDHIALVIADVSGKGIGVTLYDAVKSYHKVSSPWR